MVQLYATDIIGVTIALTLSLTLVITTAIRNWKLTEDRNEWRRLALAPATEGIEE